MFLIIRTGPQTASFKHPNYSDHDLRRTGRVYPGKALGARKRRRIATCCKITAQFRPTVPPGGQQETGPAPQKAPNPLSPSPAGSVRAARQPVFHRGFTRPGNPGMAQKTGIRQTADPGIHSQTEKPGGKPICADIPETLVSFETQFMRNKPQKERQQLNRKPDVNSCAAELIEFVTRIPRPIGVFQALLERQRIKRNP